jgi:hypothetical protein
VIIDLQRRIQEAGRIRIGQQVQSSNGKSRPAKLTTFRLTSADRQRIEQAAELYGGQPAQWTAPAGPQWEVITTADAIPVIVPPSTMAFSQHFELWSAGGCQRRCDGAFESIGDQPCVCNPDARECSLHTRLSVMIRDLPGLGVWRIDTSGWYAAVELSAAVEVIQAAAGRGAMLPARLRLEQRSVKRMGGDGRPQTRNFAVPVLDIEITPAQLLGGAATHMEIAAKPERRELTASTAAFTPVPPDLPAEPQRSIAEQAQPPAARPQRRNAAPEIPRSGRSRADGRGQPPPDAAGSDRSTTAQNRAMHALFREAAVTDRDERLKLTGLLLGRDIDTSAGLTSADASTVIDALNELAKAPGGLAVAVDGLLGRDDADDEQDAADDPAEAEQ